MKVEMTSVQNNHDCSSVVLANAVIHFLMAILNTPVLSPVEALMPYKVRHDIRNLHF